MENGVNAHVSSGISADYFCGTGRKNLGMHRHNNSEVLFVLEGHLFYVQTIYLIAAAAALYFSAKRSCTRRTSIRQSSTADTISISVTAI